MNFWKHLNSAGLFELKGVSYTVAERFSELTSLGHGVADLLSHYTDEFGHLPVDTLRSMSQAHRTWLIWRRRRGQIDEAREQAKLPPFPEPIYEQAPRPDQLDAVARTARLCPASQVPSTDAWLEVLKAGVELWSRCMELGRKDGKVRSEATDLSHPQIAEFDAYVKATLPLADLAPHRWLALRRGERLEVLTLNLELPVEGFREQVELFKERLGPVAVERTAESLLEELVLGDLEPWLRRILDSEAQQQAINAAAEALMGLLRVPPMQVRQVGGVYLTKARGPVALVISDREGDPLDQKVIRAEDNWPEKVREYFQEKGITHIILPTSTVEAELLTALESHLAPFKMTLIKVRTAALSEARVTLMNPPLRLRSTVASAMVLVRRALDPLKEWSTVDPVSIGIAEYQHELNTDLLRAALRETYDLCRLERRRGKRVHMGQSSKGNPTMAKLNPLVRSIADLRTGMVVHGIITNISHFGAFVNIGLPQEALVHISELSDSFVSNPNEVVTIGQQITARVLAMEPSRGRISLTLKARSRLLNDQIDHRPRGDRALRGPQGVRAELPAPPPRPSRNASRDRDTSRTTSPMTKSQALANLEKLFKK